jgi:hypothetical protein
MTTIAERQINRSIPSAAVSAMLTQYINKLREIDAEQEQQEQDNQVPVDTTAQNTTGNNAA